MKTTMKWLPLMVMALAASGLISSFILTSETMGLSLVVAGVAVALSALIRVKGPLRQPTLDEPPDEREQSWSNRANLYAFGTVALIAMAGTMGFAGWMMFAGASGYGAPFQMGVSLFAFGMVLFVMFMLLPTLFASWSMPDIIEDESEPDGGLRFVRPRRR